MSKSWTWTSIKNTILPRYRIQKSAKVFVAHPTLQASVAQGHFFGGSGRRAVAHMRSAFSKNAYGPVGIPSLGVPQAINPTSPKVVKAWGEGPLKPKEIPRHRDTLGQIRASTTWPAKALPSTWRGLVQNQSVAKMIWTAAEVDSRNWMR